MNVPPLSPGTDSDDYVLVEKESGSDLDSLNFQLDRFVGIFVSIRKVNKEVKVYFDDQSGEFVPHAHKICHLLQQLKLQGNFHQDYFSKMIDLALQGVQTVSSLYYNIGWGQAENALNRIEEQIFEILNLADSQIEHADVTEHALDDFLEKLNMLEERIHESEDGLKNLPMACGAHTESLPDVNERMSSLRIKILDRLGKCRIKIHQRLPHLAELTEEQRVVQNTLTKIVLQILEETQLPVSIEGESVEDLLKKLSPEGCYQFMRYVVNFWAGREPFKDDDPAKKIGNLQFKGEPLHRIIQKMPRKELDSLKIYLVNYWYTEGMHLKKKGHS